LFATSARVGAVAVWVYQVQAVGVSKNRCIACQPKTPARTEPTAWGQAPLAVSGATSLRRKKVEVGLARAVSAWRALLA